MSRDPIDRAIERDLIERAYRRPAGDVARGDIVVQTTKVSTYPTSSPAVFACRIVDVDFVEQEGETGTLTPNLGSTIYVYNNSPVVPYLGARTLAWPIVDRWVMEYYGPKDPPS